jgi:endogenous inhibitor of DNA gyrase (YacG/DUF329 family)
MSIEDDAQALVVLNTSRCPTCGKKFGENANVRAAAWRQGYRDCAVELGAKISHSPIKVVCPKCNEVWRYDQGNDLLERY